MKNFDNKEIDKFNAVAQDWWNPNGAMKSLHAMNPLRLQWLHNFVKFNKNQNVLDIGCGGGILSESLAKLGANVTAIDMSNVIEVAKKHSKMQNLNINYIQTNLADFIANNTEKKFDIITCMELLEHVPYPVQIIESCSKIMHNKSQLFISTINRNLKSLIQAIVGAEYILKLLEKGTHEYKKFIQPYELRKWANDYNLNMTHTIGISYNIFNKTFFLSNNINVNYLTRLVAII